MKIVNNLIVATVLVAVPCFIFAVVFHKAAVQWWGKPFGGGGAENIASFKRIYGPGPLTTMEDVEWQEARTGLDAMEVRYEQEATFYWACCLFALAGGAFAYLWLRIRELEKRARET